MAFTFESAVDINEKFEAANTAILNAKYLSDGEKEMLLEINMVRVYPKEFIDKIDQLYNTTRADSVRLSAMVSESIKKKVRYEDYGEVITIDTIRNNYYESRVTAINELMEELQEAKSLEPLLPSESMFVTARKHGTAQSVHNYIDHYGKDGTWPLQRLKRDSPWIVAGNENIASGIGTPQEMVIQLLVDSGVSKRGHRKNILNPAWTHFTCYNVKELNKVDYKWWIQEFAH